MEDIDVLEKRFKNPNSVLVEANWNAVVVEDHTIPHEFENLVDAVLDTSPLSRQKPKVRRGEFNYIAVRIEALGIEALLQKSRALLADVSAEHMIIANVIVDENKRKQGILKRFIYEVMVPLCVRLNRPYITLEQVLSDDLKRVIKKHPQCWIPYRYQEDNYYMKVY